MEKLKKRKFWICLSLFILIILPFIKVTYINAQDINNKESLQAYFEGFLHSQMEEYNVPGVTLSLVKDGAVVLEEGYGYYDLENKNIVDPNTTLFRPGSGTKLFVWTSVMQLVEEGEIDLNEDINTYLDFAIPAEVIGVKDENVQPITMMHLMNHTSGFEEMLEQLFVLSADDVNPLGNYLKNHIPVRVFPAGEQIAYSNYGSALAAYIVERVSGMSFYEYVEQNIFSPLNMSRSTLRQPVPSSINGNVSYGYAYIQGEYKKDEFEYVQPYPAGSLSSTAADMSKFMLAHLNNGFYGGNRILEAETAREMHSQSFTHYEDFSGMAHGFIEMNYNGYRIITHGGDTFLFHSGIYLIPELDLGLFVSYNGRDAALARDSLIKNFLDRYYPSEKKIIPQEAGSNFIDNAKITGTYYPNRSNFTSYQSIVRIITQTNINLTQDGNLIYNFMGENHRLEQIAPKVFYDKDMGNKLYALENDAGVVTRLYTNGPNGLLKAKWFETLNFNLIFLIGYVIFGLIFSIILIKSLFKRYIRNKYIIEKITVVIFTIAVIGFFIAIGILLANTHPLYNIPYLFLEETPAFDNILMMLWILPVLSVILVIMNVRIWLKGRWNVLQKGIYTLFTLWSIGITGWFYYWNFLQF